MRMNYCAGSPTVTTTGSSPLLFSELSFLITGKSFMIDTHRDNCYILYKLSMMPIGHIYYNYCR